MNILGFDKQRRRLAKELGVDPYTTNQMLSARLDEVTWAAFAGGLGVNVLTSLVPGGLILSSSSRLSDWVWDTAPGDLRVQIGDTLLAIGAPRDQVDRFLRHSYYTLSMQAVVADSLRSLEGVQGRADVLPLILSVGSEGQARFLVQTLDMIRTYHLTKEPLNRLQVQGTIIGVGPTWDHSVVMAPVDYLSWTETLGTFSVSNLAGDERRSGRALCLGCDITGSAKDQSDRTPLDGGRDRPYHSGCITRCDDQRQQVLEVVPICSCPSWAIQTKSPGYDLHRSSDCAGTRSSKASMTPEPFRFLQTTAAGFDRKSGSAETAPTGRTETAAPRCGPEQDGPAP